MKKVPRDSKFYQEHRMGKGPIIRKLPTMTRYVKQALGVVSVAPSKPTWRRGKGL